MKKFLSVLICLIILCCTVACDKGNTPSKFESKPDTMQEFSVEEKMPYIFFSKQERMPWKDYITNVLSFNNFHEQIEYGCLGMALMDLNFDSTPELIAAYAGGSMGNVCIVAYDLEGGEELCVLGDTPHYQDWDNIYLCIYRNDEGNYLIVNEGSLRNGPEWYLITSTLSEEFKFDALFEKVVVDGADNRYYYNDNEVNKTEFEKQKEQFKNDYREIKETQIQIVYWDAIDAKNKSDAISAMADALVNSAQEFIDFGIDRPITQKPEEQVFTTYKTAYLDFLKNKKEEYLVFDLVYIDNDDIPELYLSGACEAVGDMICSFKNGVVVYQYLGRIGGGKYIERSEKIINQNGHMGRYYDNVYNLDENGFSEILNANYTERYEDIGDGSGKVNTYYEYFIDNIPVSEAEYNNAVNSAFDFSKAISFYENTVSYAEIVMQLGGDNSVG